MRFSQTLSNILWWVFVFVTGTIYEFAIVVLPLHKAWTQSDALIHAVNNLLAVSILGMISGIFFVAILFAAQLSRWKERVSVVPAAAVATAIFAAIPVGFRVYGFLSSYTEWTRWILSLLAVLVACVLIFMASSKAIFHLKKGARARLAPAILIFLPILYAAGTLIFQNHRFAQNSAARGSIQYVVLISIDTLRFDYVSSYDPTNVHTPVLDQIAREGARFQVAISPVPQTGPSHISMLTGLSPVEHGILLNGQRLPGSAKTIANQLRDAGFHTAAFVSGFPLKMFNCNLQTGFGVYNDTLAFNDRFGKVFYGRLIGRLPFFELGVYRQAHEVTEPTLKWLKNNADAPFFLFLHYYDPHYPYGIKAQRRRFKRPMFVNIPQSDVARQKQLYAGEVNAVDQQIGRVVDFLKHAGIYDQTLLLVTSDHGESLGEHNYFYNHERYIYEQLIRVPFILRCPPLINAGKLFDKQVAVGDVYKTIAAAAGVVPLPGNRGFDLIQLISPGAQNYERLISSYHFAYQVEGIRSDSWKLIYNGKAKKKWKQFELYHLIRDPGETVNLFNTEKEIARKLISHLSLSRKLLTRDERELSREQIEVLKSLGYMQ